MSQGFPLRSLLATFGISGVIIGLGARQSLSNYFFGLMLLSARPFKLGDLIEFGPPPQVGVVRAVKMTYTALDTLDNVRVIVPNSVIWRNRIINFSVYSGWDVLAERQKETDFPMLAANLVRRDGGKPPLRGYTLVKVGDVQVKGLSAFWVQRSHKKMDPGHLAGLRVGDPVKVVDSLAVVLRGKKAQCVIVLAHIDETSALNFAREVEGVELIVAGGFSDLDRGLQVPRLIRLINGLTLVVTPSNGMSVGRVLLHLSPDSEGDMKVVDVSAEQIPVDRSVDRDPETERLVNDLRQRYKKATEQRIGQISGKKTHRDQGLIVAGMMRRYLNSEVGIINRGGLGLVPSNRVLKVGHIDHLIPFDDRLVKMRLTGAQLLSIFPTQPECAWGKMRG